MCKIQHQVVQAFGFPHRAPPSQHTHTLYTHTLTLFLKLKVNWIPQRHSTALCRKFSLYSPPLSHFRSHGYNHFQRVRRQGRRSGRMDGWACSSVLARNTRTVNNLITFFFLGGERNNPSSSSSSSSSPLVLPSAQQ